jgi:molybdenum cofactor guanylyltransferase
MRIAGVIIAGGKSSRMGGYEKSFLPLAGKPLLAHVIERLRPQVHALAINANGDPARFASFGLPVIADLTDMGTPLAGLEAAFAWAAEQQAEWLLTAPSDSPLLPSDLAARLAAHPPAIAESRGQAHYLTGLWPVSLHAMLRTAMEADGLRAVRRWVELCGAQHIIWETTNPDPFLNINSPQDLTDIKAKMERPHA